MKSKKNPKSGLILSRVHAIVIFLMTILTNVCLSSCEQENLRPTDIGETGDTLDIIGTKYYNSERTLSLSAASNDSLAKSVVTFQQTASMIYYDIIDDAPIQRTLNTSPQIYCNAVLTYPRINLTADANIATTLKRSYTQSQTPYNNGYTRGMDIIKVFEYANGQIATVRYGWRYLCIVSNTDTLAMPHAEITNFTFINETNAEQGVITDTEKPYRATLAFDAALTTKGVSGKQTTNHVAIKPYYDKVVTKEATPTDVTGEPQYSDTQTWNGNIATITVTKTTPHTIKPKEVETYTKSFTISMTDLSNGRLDAENTNFATASTHTETSSVATDGPWQVASYLSNYTHTVSNGTVKRQMNQEITDAIITFNDGKFHKNYNLRLSVTHSESFGSQTTDGEYDVTPHKLTVTASTNGKTLTTTGITNIYVKRTPSEPDKPNYGKPLDFKVTATYDPSASVTRRAFVFRWEKGVTYAVCLYETLLPKSSDFTYKADTYSGYNSVGYDASASNHWQPARGADDMDAIRWYRSNGSLMSGIDKALTCKIIGWKNIVGGQYALTIPGYSYTIDGYNITVTAPNGSKVTFNSYHD